MITWMMAKGMADQKPARVLGQCMCWKKSILLSEDLIYTYIHIIYIHHVWNRWYCQYVFIHVRPIACNAHALGDRKYGIFAHWNLCSIARSVMKRDLVFIVVWRHRCSHELGVVGPGLLLFVDCKLREGFEKKWNLGVCVNFVVDEIMK